MNPAPYRPVTAMVVIGAMSALLATADCGSSADSAAFAWGAGGTDLDAGGSGGGDSSTCTSGEFVCEGNVARKCGSADPTKDCSQDPDKSVCAPGLGCVRCEPGSEHCDAATGMASYCASDGLAKIEFECDPVQGMLCAKDGCKGACSPQKLGRTHVGCDFYPTVTANTVWRKWFSFGVVVTNAGSAEAKVKITLGDSTVLEGVVAKDGHTVFELPWVEDLKGADADSKGGVIPPIQGTHALAAAGAFRLRSDQPVTVVQYNALDSENPEGVNAGCPDPFSLGRCLSLSNDASLLVPVTSMMSGHTILGWHNWHLDTDPILNMPDLIAITAVHDKTAVTVRSGKLTYSAKLPQQDYPDKTMSPEEDKVFVLHRGEVLQLFTDGSASKSAQWSGSKITSSQPVQVISGAPCVNVPDDTVACDHIEEFVPPTELLGRDYLVSTPSTKIGDTRHIVRILALAADTSLKFEPTDVHSSVTLGEQETLEIDTARDFQVTSTKTFGVTQYMVGHGGGAPPTGGAGVGEGDPSQSLTVPRSRYLKDYVFATPKGFDNLTLNVIAPSGATVKLNGVARDPKTFSPIGSTGYGVARVTLDADTRYEVRCDQPIGAQLYGYGAFTSFMVPIGVDLRPTTSQ